MGTMTYERKRSSYARVLVEINLAAPVKKKITLEYDDGDYVDCEFFVENQLKFCKTCCSLGHNELECSDLARRASVLPAPPPGRVTFVDVVRVAPIATSILPRSMVSPSIAPQVVPSRPLVGDIAGMKVGVRDNVKPSSVDPGLIHDNMDGIDLSTGTGLGSDMGKLILVPAVDASDSKGRQGHDEEQVQIESDDDSSWTKYLDGEDVVDADKKDVRKRVDALVEKLVSSVPS